LKKLINLRNIRLIELDKLRKFYSLATRSLSLSLSQRATARDRKLILPPHTPEGEGVSNCSPSHSHSVNVVHSHSVVPTAEKLDLNQGKVKLINKKFKDLSSFLKFSNKGTVNNIGFYKIKGIGLQIPSLQKIKELRANPNKYKEKYGYKSEFMSPNILGQLAIKSIKNYNMNIRKFLYKYNIMNQIKNSQSILYNFIKIKRRINTLDSFDYTGSLLRPNISVLLKYFFLKIGPALISKPIFIFNHNKVIIQLGYYIKKYSKYKVKNMRELKLIKLFKVLAIHLSKIKNSKKYLITKNEKKLMFSMFRRMCNMDMLTISRNLPDYIDFNYNLKSYI
jgi:hypothetical protein